MNVAAMRQIDICLESVGRCWKTQLAPRGGANGKSKSRTSPGLRLTCGDLFHRRANPLNMFAEIAAGNLSSTLRARCRVSRCFARLCTGTGGSAGLRPQHLSGAGAP